MNALDRGTRSEEGASCAGGHSVLSLTHELQDALQLAEAQLDWRVAVTGIGFDAAFHHRTLVSEGFKSSLAMTSTHAALAEPAEGQLAIEQVTEDIIDAGTT